jgi:yecA family protein
MNFSKSQALQLEALLDQSKYPDVLNYQECHGFLCGLIAGPVDLEANQRNQSIFFGDEISDLSSIPEEAKLLISLLHQEIGNTFFSSETLLLPCSLQLDGDEISESLEDWALGFFEAHMLNESNWYAANEDITAEMLMPFFLCLDEIEEEEIIAIKKNKELFQKLISQIPQALQDLYLYFHVNDA